jgi:hypothetical protein
VLPLISMDGLEMGKRTTLADSERTVFDLLEGLQLLGVRGADDRGGESMASR